MFSWYKDRVVNQEPNHSISTSRLKWLSFSFVTLLAMFLKLRTYAAIQSNFQYLYFLVSGFSQSFLLSNTPLSCYRCILSLEGVLRAEASLVSVTSGILDMPILSDSHLCPFSQNSSILLGGTPLVPRSVGM